MFQYKEFFAKSNKISQKREGTSNLADKMMSKEMDRRSMMASELFERANLDSIRSREGLASLANPRNQITSKYVPSRSVKELQTLTTRALKQSDKISNNNSTRNMKYTIPTGMNKKEYNDTNKNPLEGRKVTATNKVEFRGNSRTKQSASTENISEAKCSTTHRCASQSATETVDVKFCTIPNKAFQDYMKKHSRRDKVNDHKIYRTIMLSNETPIDSLSNLSKVQETFEKSIKNAALKSISSIPPKQINEQQRKYRSMSYKIPHFETNQENNSLIK
ncbi:uncharacterized protein LOC111049949 [Nilaparvata lugens]|uniref:uncharacterized protein LOC111049949 n=1 Tax=Nilaparvata lugens TaxID=108931 RepID=UPI00193DDE03|nr:uncharacterized protein LOC111049949 [Nilaparvata lugens]